MKGNLDSKPADPSEPLRTTLTVGPDIRSRFEDLAKIRNIKIAEAARMAVGQFVETQERLAHGGTALVAQEVLELSSSLNSNPYQELLANL